MEAYEQWTSQSVSCTGNISKEMSDRPKCHTSTKCVKIVRHEGEILAKCSTMKDGIKMLT